MKSALIVLVLLIAIGGGYWLYQNRLPAVGPMPPSPPPAAVPSAAPPEASGGAAQVISMTASGFLPTNLTIKVGDTVTFKNDDTPSHWPASGLHPTHLLCPGFDALKPVAAGETYSFTFRGAKECPMHDHLTPSIRGKITVTP